MHARRAFFFSCENVRNIYEYVVQKIAGEIVEGNRNHEFAGIRKVLLREIMANSLADRAMTR